MDRGRVHRDCDRRQRHLGVESLSIDEAPGAAQEDRPARARVVTGSDHFVSAARTGWRGRRRRGTMSCMTNGSTAAARTPAAGNDSRWDAVTQRDRRADGRFVYAVRSTGIFCRPSCPSRRPRRDRVEFFATPVEARTAGFRPCRRCHPEGGGNRPLIERALAAWARLSRADEPVTLARLAAATGSSPFHLQRTFTRELGL